MTEKLHRQIKRIPAHSISKLNSYGLLLVASEYEKYPTNELLEQISKVHLTEEQKDNLLTNLESFETTTSYGSWSVASRTVR